MARGLTKAPVTTPKGKPRVTLPQANLGIAKASGLKDTRDYRKQALKGDVSEFANAGFGATALTGRS